MGGKYETGIPSRRTQDGGGLGDSSSRKSRPSFKYVETVRVSWTLSLPVLLVVFYKCKKRFCPE